MLQCVLLYYVNMFCKRNVKYNTARTCLNCQPRHDIDHNDFLNDINKITQIVVLL